MVSKDIAQHIAIIMDGNGRWAKAHGVTRSHGHEQGAESVRSVVETAVENGIAYITLYAFSSENWKRPQQEIDFLMDLLENFLYAELALLCEKFVRLRVVGRRDRLSDAVLKAIEHVEHVTKHHQKMTLILAVDYGGRSDIMHASVPFVRLLQERLGKSLDDITEADIFSLGDHLGDESFAAGLWAGDVPDPDLIIRTSGEYRLSNFLLWQSAYAELYITNKMWPDFRGEDLLEALNALKARERRYGAIKEDDYE